jgi:hypothetical protein
VTKAKALFWAAATLLVLAGHPVGAVDRIPETSGFSGFAIFGPSSWNVSSNLFVRGAPIVLDEVGDAQIASIFDAPSSNSSPGIVAGGEFNYTFAGTGTQVFVGNRLEDVLRLDLAFGVGVRQSLGNGGIFAASVLTTPTELEVWSDPYVESENRTPTEVNRPGLRLRWGRIFNTGLELTLTTRDYRHDTETSGDWLIAQGRLDPADQPLLIREGEVWRAQALYRIDTENKRHRFEPAIRYNNDNHDGAAMSNQGSTLKLTYLYMTPKIVLDTNFVIGSREADAVHPVYGQTLNWNRYGVGLTAIIPVKLGENNRWRVFVGGEFFREDANVDFFDTQVASILAGVLWRYNRP